MEIFEIILVLLGGFAAGVMNALAGFGSVITLALLMEVFGLPGNLANGTNRVNILAMASSSAYLYHRKGKLDLKRGRWILLIMVIGAIFGVWLAISISNDQFKSAFKWLLLFIFIMLVFNPKKMLRSVSDETHKIHWGIMVPVFLVLGFYNGFIQMGGGLLFLIAIVILGKYNLTEGNALKLTIVSFQTLLVITIFHINGLVNWKIGAMLAVGQVIGGLIAVNYVTKWPKANTYAYYFLIIIVFVMLLRYFAVFNF
jgi:uncharacterized membrane protein YfcA